MSRFLLQSGSLTISGSDGLTRFNSNDGLFHVVNSISGSVNILPLTFSDGTNYNLTNDTFVGNCNTACTDIVGSVKFTLGDQVGGFPFDRWQTMMGGSCAVWLMDGHGSVGLNPDPNINVNQFVFYYFFISNGGVYLRRRAYNSKSSQGTYTVKAHTIAYKLKCGLYT
jgi:hypothetical protein